MGFKLGPILSFRGLGGESNVEWRVSALIVQDSADGEPSLEWQADVRQRAARPHRQGQQRQRNYSPPWLIPSPRGKRGGSILP